MNTKELVLWAVFVITAEISAFNLQIEEEAAKFIVSPIVNLLGVKNSSDDVAQLPSDVDPSYFGYSFSFYNKTGGDIGIIAGAPKTVDPNQLGLQEVSGFNSDPKGSIESCPVPASLFTGGSSVCSPVNPPNLIAGDNLGLTVTAQENGNALTCSTTRPQDCGTLRYSPGTCFATKDYGETWSPTHDTTPLECPTTDVEVLFVLDGSGSIGTNFESVLAWVKQISEKIGIDKGVVTVGVVQYSHYSEDYEINKQPWIVTEIEIGEYKTYKQFANAVDKIILHGYTTYTGRTLEKVMTDFQNTEHYNNPTTKQVMILLTDGIASDATLVPENAEKLRDIGVIPFAVGVGDETEVNRTELQLIANGKPGDDTRVFMASSFSGLDAIAKELEAEIGGLALEGGVNQNGTGSELQFGQSGISIAYSKQSPHRRRRDTSTAAVVKHLVAL